MWCSMWIHFCWIPYLILFVNQTANNKLIKIDENTSNQNKFLERKQINILFVIYLYREILPQFLLWYRCSFWYTNVHPHWYFFMFVHILFGCINIINSIHYSSYLVNSKIFLCLLHIMDFWLRIGQRHIKQFVP